MIAVPGLKEQPQDELKKLFETWAEGDDSELFNPAFIPHLYLLNRLIVFIKSCPVKAGFYELSKSKILEYNHTVVIK